MKRICLFAGYDSKNIIHDYVVYYLKELSTVADVYYMADNEISDDEKAKITPYVKYANGKHMGAYDMGSWNYLVNILGWEKLSEYDELILTNDSVYGPLYPIKELFEKIGQDNEWDICGIDRVYNKNVNKYFLSNYFLVFRNNTFKTDIFKNHINNLVYNGSRDDIINTYEAPFMDKFIQAGYTVKCILQKDVNVYHHIKETIEYGSPFIKVKGLLSEEILLKDLLYIQKKYNYPAKYIIPKIKKRFLRDIRRKLFQINIKKDRLTIRLFGIYIIKKEPQKKEVKIYDYDKENCPIKVIGS